MPSSRWTRALPLALGCITVIAPAAQAEGRAFLRLDAGAGSRVHATLHGAVPRGVHEFRLDGRRLVRTAHNGITFRLASAPQRSWRMLVVRQAGSHRLIARKRFRVARAVAAGSRSLPTLLLTSTPPASTESTSASFGFSVSGFKPATTCSLDGAAYAACSNPASYSGLALGSHRFTVRATNRIGSVTASYAWSIVAPTTTTPTTTADTTAPTAPVLSATAGDGQAALSWTAASDNVGVSSYAVYTNGIWQTGLPNTARSWTATGLTNGTSYSFRVVALDAAGNWTNSNTVGVTPQAVAAPTTTTMGSGPAAGRTLVFDDEFDGTAVDTTKWGVYDSAGHAGNGLRRPSAFSVGGGLLTITAQMVNGVIVSGGMSRWTTQTYGYYEFRVRTEVDPTGTMSGLGLTYAASHDGTKDGENDFYETGHAANTRSPFYTYIHYPNATTGANNQYRFVHQADGTQWHTMGMDWSPTAIKIYRDGVLVWTLTDAYAIPDAAHKFCLQLDAMLTQTLTQPVHMYVDYVRIYQ